MAGDGAALTLAERRELLVGARRAFCGLDGELWAAGGSDLGVLLGEVDAVVAAGESARVSVVAEAVARGEPGSGERALSPVGWVREHAPSLRSGGAGQVVRVAEALRVPGNAPVKAAVVSGRLPVGAASAVVCEADRLRPLLAPGAEGAVVEGLVRVAAEHGPGACRSLRTALLARYGLDDVLDRDAAAAKRWVALSQPRVGPLGAAEYRLCLDPEGRAVLEAALGPLSAPVPVGGERDLRPADQRRGEALVTLVRRGVAGAGSVPATTKAQLFVTVDLDTLRDRVLRDATGPTCAGVGSGRMAAGEMVGCGSGEAIDCGGGRSAAGEVVGGSQAGLLLAPAEVRRLACDAAVIPTVLGSEGQVVDLGCAVRLFTASQVRRLWLRDRGCSFPGCTMPAQWTDAHHLVHWADGGPSDLANAALLCQRHHTVVHQRRLAGRVDPDGTVSWDLLTGSYDAALAALAAREPA
jgi:hypothetical protein